jgi:cytochrome c6
MKVITKSLIVLSSLAFVAAVHAADAKENWDKQCKSCHGADGKGQTTMGKKVGCKDYTDAKVQEAMKDDAAYKSVKDGMKEGDKILMKPFAEKLTDTEIKALIAHMRTFKK